VPVEANLRDYHPYRACHSEPILTGARISRAIAYLLISRRLSQST
jgi:hypothetical protein